MPSEQYRAIRGSEREPLSGATKTGSCDQNEAIQVTVVLRHRPSTEKLASPAELVARGSA